MKILKALHDGGVGVPLGSDAPQQFNVPGFSIHREMRRMADAGMSNYEIVKSGTANVGQHFKAQDAFGTIAVGQRADLILVDAKLCRTWATWRNDRASWCVDAGCQRRRSTPGSQRSQPPDEAFHGCSPLPGATS